MNMDANYFAKPRSNTISDSLLINQLANVSSNIDNTNDVRTSYPEINNSLNVFNSLQSSGLQQQLKASKHNQKNTYFANEAIVKEIS